MDLELGELYEGGRTQIPSPGERRICSSMRGEIVLAVTNIVGVVLMVAAPLLLRSEVPAPYLLLLLLIGLSTILVACWRLWKQTNRPRPAVMVLSETGIWVAALRETIVWSRIEKLVPQAGYLSMTLRKPLSRPPRIFARPLFRSRDAVRREVLLPLRGLEIPTRELSKLIIAEHAAHCGSEAR